MKLEFSRQVFAKYPNGKYHDVTARLKLPGYRLQYFAQSSVNTNPSHGIYTGIEANMLIPKRFTLWISTNNWLFVLEISPQSRKQDTRKKKKTCKVSRQTKEHLRTVAHCYTRKKIQTVHWNETCQTSTHVDCIWNVMAHAQKPDFVFRQNGGVNLNRGWVSVESTTGSRGVRFSGSNAGYTMFRGSVKGTG